jgi:hypothetical protein
VPKEHDYAQFIPVNVQATYPIKTLGFPQEDILHLLDGKEVTFHNLSDGFICLQEKFTTKPGAVYLLYLGGNNNA